MGKSSKLIAACTVAVSLSQFTAPVDIVSASSPLPLTESFFASEPNVSAVDAKLPRINAEIDFKLASYMDDEDFSPELLEMANMALARLNASSQELHGITSA